MNVTAYDLAARFIGVKEVPGVGTDPWISAWLELSGAPHPAADETSWCSGFSYFPFWLLGLPAKPGLGARAWLTQGKPVSLAEALRGYDVVVLKRGGGDQPGPEVINASGHVTLFDRLEGETVYGLGGNQSNAVSIAAFPVARMLGIRRLHTEA